MSELASLLAALGIASVFTGSVLVRRRPLRERRLESFVSALGKPSRSGSPRIKFNPMRWVKRLAYLGILRLLPRTWVSETRRLLEMAGYSQGRGAEGFLAVRVVMSVGFAAAGFVLFNASPVPELGGLMALVLGAIGLLLPTFWLKSRVKNRQRLIMRAMPNALDLLSVSVEAGLGFDQALVEICTKWHNPLTQEFTTFLNEIRLGSSRKDALRGLAKRTGVPELRMFVSALIQADELGSGISRTLQSQAEQIRIRRRQHAQEQAHQAPVKMAFPLVFFMLPALFVVLLGPAIPVIMKSLGG